MDSDLLNEQLLSTSTAAVGFPHIGHLLIGFGDARDRQV